MKFIYLFIVLVITQSYSQNYQIDYKVSIIDNKDEFGIVGFSIARLITDKTESLTFGKNVDTTAIINGQEEPHFQQASEFSPSQYKEFIIGKRYSSTLFSKYNLKDENYSIVWRLEETFKSILGYNCQKASGNYRGRDYIAYFTTDIPIQNGPHTFDNLPGLVLEVHSTDNVVSFKAINVKTTSEKIFNPFSEENKTYISWEEFMIGYKNYFNKMSNYKPEEDIIFTVPNRSIEIYFEQ